MAANILGVSHQQNVQSSSISAQSNAGRAQSAQQPSQYGFDHVTLSTSVAPAAAASGTKNADGTTQYAEQPENRSRSVKSAKNQTVKALDNNDEQKDNKENYELLKWASQLKGVLGGLVGIIKGQA